MLSEMFLTLKFANNMIAIERKTFLIYGFARSNLLPYLSGLGMSISMKNKKLIPVFYVIL